MMNENDLHLLGLEYVQNVYNDYQAAKPFKLKQYVDVFPEDFSRPLVTGEVLGMYWKDDPWGWMVIIEVSDHGRKYVEEHPASLCRRCTKFRGHLV